MTRNDVYQQTLRAYKHDTRIVIKDLYGHNPTVAKLLLDRLEQCDNERAINKLLVWGRTNLL